MFFSFQYKENTSHIGSLTSEDSWKIVSVSHYLFPGEGNREGKYSYSFLKCLQWATCYVLRHWILNLLSADLMFVALSFMFNFRNFCSIFSVLKNTNRRVSYLVLSWFSHAGHTSSCLMTLSFITLDDVVIWTVSPCIDSLYTFVFLI